MTNSNGVTRNKTINTTLIPFTKFPPLTVGVFKISNGTGSVSVFSMFIYKELYSANRDKVKKIYNISAFIAID
jgi:hypothetical protein